jgi:uncharacterized protein (UPF0261 family)
MIYPVVDIAGLNRISRQVIRQGAAAVVAMAEAAQGALSEAADRPLIGATMFGVTTPCVTQARERLEAAGYEVLVFHATGTGGRTLERLVADGLVDAVLDLTTTEWADEVVGGILAAGPERLTAAGRLGVPQVVSLGATDMVNFGPPDSLPTRFADRLLYRHNAENTLMRVSVAEAAEIGAAIGERLAAATGPTTVLVPTRGVSALDAAGQPFDDPAARAALAAAVRARVPVEEHDLHINDPAFADLAAVRVLAQIEETNPMPRTSSNEPRTTENAR